ncbi:hypothetical protein [Caballeronia concitans]|nr:hypothetical protein [Caballeronia concitans]
MTFPHAAMQVDVTGTLGILTRPTALLASPETTSQNDSRSRLF